MSEHSPDSSQAPKADGPLATLQNVEDVDVTRYKTKELTERFQQLFGVVHLLPWAAAGLGGCVVMTLTTWAVLFLPQAPTGVAVLAFVYMGFQGLFLGLLAGALLVVARIFQQLTAVLDITLQTVKQAFTDIKNIGDPDVRAELIAALVHGAVMPAVKSAVTVKMGLLKAPIGFVLNKLLDRSAKKMTKNLKDKTRAAGEFPDVTEEPAPAHAATADEATPSTELTATADSHLDRMRERVEVIARRTRRATLIPATLLFIAAAALSSIPWIFALPLLFF